MTARFNRSPSTASRLGTLSLLGLAGLAAAPAWASAQGPLNAESSDDGDLPEIAAEELDALMHDPDDMKRDMLMEVNIRSRYMSLFFADSILDNWYYDDDTEGHPDRPAIYGYAFGLEYVIKKDQANGIFYLEYARSLTRGGYWDDVEDDTPNYADGEYILPENLGIFTIGADYGMELHAEPWLSFIFGGGLGLGILTGDIIQWNSAIEAEGDPQCEQGDPSLLGDPETATALERFDAGCGDDGPKGMPSVIPMVDINVGVRFNFSDRATLRLETGLHSLLYVGMATGVVF